MMGNYIIRKHFLYVLFVFLGPDRCASTWISTNYTVTTTNDVVDQTIVALTFQQTRTTIECGARCSESAAESFYYIGGSSTCHCNNVKDTNIVPSGAPGVMRYGYTGDLPATTTVAPTTTTTEDVSTTTTATDVPTTATTTTAVPTTSPTTTAAPTTTAVYTTCNDMSTGWTVFQRRFDGSVDFFRNWTDYVNGFGNSQVEFWLGLEALHQAVAVKCELCITMEAGPNPATTQQNGYAMYSSFTIGDASTKYQLAISGFSGNVGDNLAFHNNQPFSTPDNDSSSGCADAGAWWFASCHRVSLNGLYLNGVNTDYGNGINWRDPWGYDFSLLKTEMAYRC